MHETARWNVSQSTAEPSCQTYNWIAGLLTDHDALSLKPQLRRRVPQSTIDGFYRSAKGHFCQDRDQFLGLPERIIADILACEDTNMTTLLDQLESDAATRKKLLDQYTTSLLFANGRSGGFPMDYLVQCRREHPQLAKQATTDSTVEQYASWPALQNHKVIRKHELSGTTQPRNDTLRGTLAPLASSLSPRLTWPGSNASSLTLTSASRKTSSGLPSKHLKASDTSQFARNVKPSRTPQPDYHTAALAGSGESGLTHLENIDTGHSALRSHAACFSNLPGKVRRRIHSIALPCPSVLVVDSVLAAQLRDLRRRGSRRTSYKLEDDLGRKWETTYFGRPTNGRSPLTSLAAFGINHAIYNEAARYFYSHTTFLFYGSPQSVQAFLHDRAHNLHLIRNVSLAYHFSAATTPDSKSANSCEAFSTNPAETAPQTPMLSFTTKPSEWRHLLNILIFACPGLRSCELIIDASIWASAPWDLGAQEVFLHPNGYEPRDGGESHRSFLQHVARLCGSSMRFSLRIMEANTEEKRRRQRMLEHYVRGVMMERPLEARKRECLCGNIKLKRACMRD